MAQFSDIEQERIQKLIADAQTEAVFDALEQACAPLMPELRTQFHTKQSAYESGLISLTEWLQAFSEINMEILRNIGVSVRAPDTWPARSVVEELIIQHRLEEAFERLQPLGTPVLLAQAEYALLQRLKDSPTTDLAAWELAMMTRLRYGLAQLARKLPEAIAPTSHSSCLGRLRRFIAKRLFSTRF